jgi:hypothetical protein
MELGIEGGRERERRIGFEDEMNRDDIGYIGVDFEGLRSMLLGMLEVEGLSWST